MRREHQIGQLQQRAVGGNRFDAGGVEPGRKQLARAQGVDQRRLIHHLAARGVDQDGTAWQLRELLRAQQIARVCIERHMQAQHVRQGQEFVHAAQQFHIGDGAALAGQGGIEGDDLHAQREADIGHALADLAKADQADGFAAQLDAVLRTAPAAGVQFAVHPTDAACRGKHQAQRHLGHGLRVRSRCHVHGDATRGGGWYVDIAHADAVLGNHLEGRARRNGLGAEIHRARDDRIDRLGGQDAFDFFGAVWLLKIQHARAGGGQQFDARWSQFGGGDKDGERHGWSIQKIRDGDQLVSR